MRPSRPSLIALAVATLALVPRVVYLGADLFPSNSVALARAVETLVLRGDLAYAAAPGDPVQVLLSAAGFWVHHGLASATSAAASVTLVNALFGALAAGAAVVFARPFLRTDAAAAVAGIALAAMPIFLSGTTFATGHGIQVALLLLAGIAAERRRAVLTGVLVGLAIATRAESALAVPAILSLLWRGDAPLGFDRERGIHVRGGAGALAARLAAFAGPLLAAPLVLYAPQLSASGGTPWVQAWTDAAWLGPFSVVLPESLAHARRALSWPGVALAIAGLVVLWRRDAGRVGVLLLWVLLPALVVLNLRDAAPHHQIVALCALAVPIAAALETVGTRAPRAAGPLTTVLGIAVAAWMMWPLVPTLRARAERCLPADFARAVGAATEPDAVIVAMDLADHLDYYAERRAIRHAPLDGTSADDARIEASMDEILALVAAGTPVYVVSDAFAEDIPHGQFGLLRAEMGMEDADQRGGVETIGRWGIALIETVELRRITTEPYEDWHGAALGRRQGADPTASLYRVLASDH